MSEVDQYLEQKISKLNEETEEVLKKYRYRIEGTTLETKLKKILVEWRDAYFEEIGLMIFERLVD